jgi:heat shock protein HslJ
LKNNLRIAALLTLAATLTGACSTMEPDSATTGAGLNGSAWTLSAPAGAASGAEALPTMRFDEGRVSGSDGCNRFSGPYTSAPGKLQFAAPRVGTMMACPTDALAQRARAFDAALSATRAYRIDAGKLLLLDAAGAELLRFDAQATGLSGTAWRVGGYNNGKQAVVGVLTGTTLTVSFGGDGRISGSGGCNTFSGSYRADAEKLSIGPLAATRKACAAPEGVMAQEGAFLRALETTATARREGDRLELRTAADALAAMLRLDGTKP